MVRVMSQNTFRVLIAGVGSIGQRHLRCFQATGRAELSLCEINDELRQTIQQRYGVERVYADFEQALGAEHDAVVIATPAPLHVSLATRAVQAGLHVLIEKPLSTSLDGLEDLAALVHTKGVTVGVAYTFRHYPVLAEMREAIRSGRFGKPLHMMSFTGQNFPTYRPAYRQTYYTRRETGGGAIQDALTHVLNAGEWLVGPIDRLAADAARQALDGVEVEDTVNLIARHGDVLAAYSLNQYQAPNEHSMTVVCQRGTVRCEPYKHRWRWMVEPQGDGEWQDEQHEPLERDSLFIMQAKSFLDAIQAKREPACTLQEGIQTLKANLAALRAVDEGTWQQVR